MRRADADPALAARAATAAHRRRLREVWRSAGWPCHDNIELDLVAAGWVDRHLDAAGRETLRLSPAGVQQLAGWLGRHRAARDPHEQLVWRIVVSLQRAGRITWRGLSLRAPLPGPEPSAPRWAIAIPDVFSIRHTTVEAYAEPVIHEIKVRRADLLADLRRPDKGAAYRALAARCWYVLGPGVGDAHDVPEGFGVLLAQPDGLEVARPAPARACGIGFAVWMALARAAPEPMPEASVQWPLRDAEAAAASDLPDGPIPGLESLAGESGIDAPGAAEDAAGFEDAAAAKGRAGEPTRP
jgi:hypothetical protein